MTNAALSSNIIGIPNVLSALKALGFLFLKFLGVFSVGSKAHYLYMVFPDAVINARLFTEGAFSQAFPFVGFTVHLRRFRYPAQGIFDADIYFLCLLLPELPDNIFQKFYLLMPGTKRIADRQRQN